MTDPTSGGHAPVQSGLVTAVQFLTRVPVPATTAVPAPLATALGWFPLVGMLVGAVAAAALAVATWTWSPLVGGVGAVAAGIALTGAFHEDGLADTVDGLWGGWTPPQRLAIMRDSRLGTYGAAALVLVVLTQVSLLASMSTPDSARALLLGHVAGRATVLPLVAAMPSARSDGQGARVAAPAEGGAWVMAGTTVTAVGLVVVGAWLPVVLVAAVPAVWVVARAARDRVGGLTGDVLGAANLAAHVSVLAAVAAIARRGGFADAPGWTGLW